MGGCKPAATPVPVKYRAEGLKGLAFHPRRPWIIVSLHSGAWVPSSTAWTSTTGPYAASNSTPRTHFLSPERKEGGACCFVSRFGRPSSCQKTCRLWIVLLVILLSTSRVYSAKDLTTNDCRYDLTSIAVMSCLKSNGALRSLSSTCCKALLHAVDHVPGSSHSGICCLCRYMRDKKNLPELARAYILCKGRDRHAVKKWSFATKRICSTVCRKISNSSLAYEDHPPENSESTGMVKDIIRILWVIVVIFILMVFIPFCFLWRFKQTPKERSPAHSSTKRGWK